MTNHEHQDHDDTSRGSSALKWVLIGFLLVAGYFLFTEHRAHMAPYLPLLLLAACPLMHLFHRHGGHDGHGSGKEERGGDRDPPAEHRHEGGSR
jgi:hypothetical protein